METKTLAGIDEDVSGDNEDKTKSASNYFEDESDDEIFLVKQDLAGE
jgi:hypothetical protein